MKRDLLKAVTRWGVSIADLKLPAFYHDNSIINVIYTASTKNVLQYLPDPRMHPLEAAPGRCLVAFTAYEYRMTDIGLYNEFSIAFMISYGKKCIPSVSHFSQKRNRCFDMYIRHLPVTTEKARIGGIETYGYPKRLADIVFTRDKGVTECNVSENKTHILSLRVPELQTRPGDNVQFRNYTSRQGVTLCGDVYTKNHKYAESMDTKDVVLSIGGSHEICRELRSVDLSMKALMYQYIPSSESILSIPRNYNGP